MREISSKEYAFEISDPIEELVFDSLWEVYEVVSKRYGFGKPTWQEKKQELYDAYYEFVVGDMRDLAIKLFEECGMDIVPDGKEW